MSQGLSGAAAETKHSTLGIPVPKQGNDRKAIPRASSTVVVPSPPPPTYPFGGQAGFVRHTWTMEADLSGRPDTSTVTSCAQSPPHIRILSGGEVHHHHPKSRPWGDRAIFGVLTATFSLPGLMVRGWQVPPYISRTSWGLASLPGPALQTETVSIPWNVYPNLQIPGQSGPLSSSNWQMYVSRPDFPETEPAYP